MTQHKRGVGAIVLLCLVLPALAAEPVRHDLKLRRTVGETFTFERVQDGRIQFIPEGWDRFSTDYTCNTRDGGKVTTLAVKDGLPVAVKAAYAADGFTTTQEPGEQPKQWPSMLCGETITVSFDENGRLKHDYRGEVQDDLVRQELMGMLDDDGFLRPGKPVAVGDKWPVNEPLLRRYFELPEDGECDGECKLIAVKEVDGRKVAEVSATVNFTKLPAEGITARFESGATLIFDLATGQGVKSTGRVTITSIVKQTNPPEANRDPGRSVYQANWLVRCTLVKREP